MDGAGAWGRISTPPQMGQSRQHSGATAYFRHDDHGDGDDSIGDGDMKIMTIMKVMTSQCVCV